MTTVTINNITHQFKTAQQAKDYLFNLLDQRPNRETTQEIENNLDVLLNIRNTRPQDINALFIKSINH